MKKTRITLSNFSNAVNNSASDFVLPNNIWRYAINMDNDPSQAPYGELIVRRSTHSIVRYSNDPAESYLLGMQGVGVDKILIAVYENGETIIKELEEATLTTIGAVAFHTAEINRVRMAQFLGYTFACNGKVIKSWDGNTANNWGSTNLTNAPVGQLITEFNGRLYVAQIIGEESIVRYSAASNADGTLPDWEDLDRIPVAENDGDEIVALEKNGNQLLIFKRDSIYAYNGTSLIPISNSVGAVSQEEVTTINGMTFFKHQSSFYEFKIYMLVPGSQPVLISEPISNWLKYYSDWQYTVPDPTEPRADVNTLASWGDDGNYYVCAGSPQRGDNNAEINLKYNQRSSAPDKHCIVLKYNIETRGWTEYFLPFHEIGYVANYRTVSYFGGGNINVFGSHYGDFSGGSAFAYTFHPQHNIWDNSHEDDNLNNNNVPKEFYLQTKKLDGSNEKKGILRHVRKTINKLSIHANGNFADATALIRADGGEWVKLGSLKDTMTIFDTKLSGYYFEIKIVGTTGPLTSKAKGDGFYRGELFSIASIDIFDIDVENKPL